MTAETLPRAFLVKEQGRWVFALYDGDRLTRSVLEQRRLLVDPTSPHPTQGWPERQCGRFDLHPPHVWSDTGIWTNLTYFCNGIADQL